MDKEVLVSVIIPVYNAEKYLRECLDSVINQTLREIEIICVDDGSADGSLEILREYEAAEPRLMVLTQTNQGGGAARNHGLEYAKGKYLSILDADDFFETDMLEDCIRQIEKENADIVCFAAKQYDMRTGEIREMPWSLRTGNLPEKETFAPDEVEKLFNTFQNWAWNKIFRHEFIKEHGIRFQEIKRTNDMLFTCSALVLAKRITVIDHPYVTYRVGTGTSMQQTNSRHSTAFWSAYTETKKFLTDAGEYERYERSFLNWIIEGTLYNLKSQTDESSRRQVIDLIRNNGEKDFQFLDHGRDYYYKGKHYDDYLKIVRPESPKENGRSEEKRSKPTHADSALRKLPRRLWRGVRCVREHGWRYTWNRALDHISSPGGNGKRIKRNYAYYSSLPRRAYPEELKRLYKNITGCELHLDDPKTCSEKIQWMKLYDSTPLKTRLADKYLVREWVADKIGEEHLIPLLGVWNSFDEIDFESLPDQFVLKANHGCGWNIIVKDKESFDKEHARSLFQKWLGTNYAFKCGFEMQYLNIPPKIIAEKYIAEKSDDGQDWLNDYKVWCCNGKARFIYVDTDRFTDHKRTAFSLSWERLPVRIYAVRETDDRDIPKPATLDLMIKCAEILSDGFALVRVDFYEAAGSLYFGEMTFTPASGFDLPDPISFDLEMGSWITLPGKSRIPKQHR